MQYIRLAGAFNGIDGPFQHQMHILMTLFETVFETLGVSSPVPFEPPHTLVLCRRPTRSPILFEVEEKDHLPTPYTTLDLQWGDFVEVSTSIDIVLTRGEDGLPRTNVYLSFDRVTLLCSFPRIRSVCCFHSRIFTIGISSVLGH